MPKVDEEGARESYNQTNTIEEAYQYDYETENMMSYTNQQFKPRMMSRARVNQLKIPKKSQTRLKVLFILILTICIVCLWNLKIFQPS